MLFYVGYIFSLFFYWARVSFINDWTKPVTFRTRIDSRSSYIEKLHSCALCVSSLPPIIHWALKFWIQSEFKSWLSRSLLLQDRICIIEWGRQQFGGAAAAQETRRRSIERAINLLKSLLYRRYINRQKKRGDREGEL